MAFQAVMTFCSLIHRYALIYSRITYAICAWGSVHPTAIKRLKALFKKAISMQNSPPNRHDRSLLQYDEVYKYFTLCKNFKVKCNGKHLYFVNKMDQHWISHNYETRSNVGNYFATLFYLKSKCQNSLFYRNINTYTVTILQLQYVTLRCNFLYL